MPVPPMHQIVVHRTEHRIYCINRGDADINDRKKYAIWEFCAISGAELDLELGWRAGSHAFFSFVEPE